MKDTLTSFLSDSLKNRLQMVDDWIDAIDYNEIVGTLLLDISNAFGIVGLNHDILLEKNAFYELHSSTG